MYKYTLRETNEIAEKLNFNRNMTEKVLRLLMILKYFEHNNINEKLVLKGGTAINLFMLDMPRLSVDIDFDFHANANKEEMIEERKKIDFEVRRYMSKEGYILSEKSKSVHTLDSYVYSYVTQSGGKDVLKIEINYSDRIHVLKPVSSNSTGKFPERTFTKRLADEEVIGSKFNALLTRTTPRDIYDAFNIIKEKNSYDWDLIRKIAIFYVCLSSDIPVDFSKILKDSLAKIKRLNYQRAKVTLIPVLQKGVHFDANEIIHSVAPFLENLFCLSEKEQRFINEFNSKNFKPEILFSGKKTEDVSSHPMGIWKSMQ